MENKKIRKITADIKHPKRGNKTPITQKEQYFTREEEWKPKDRFKVKTGGFEKLKKIGLLVMLTFSSVVISYGLYLWGSKGQSIDTAKAIYGDIKSAGKNLADLKTGKAAQFLKEAEEKLNELKFKTGLLKAAPGLKEIPRILDNVKKITRSLGEINKRIEFIKEGGFDIVFNDGDKLISILKDISKILKDVEPIAGEIRNSAAKFNAFPQEANDGYIALSSDLKSAIDVLDSVIVILESVMDRYFLVVFENPTEIRPGGGFVGSYADLVLSGGAIKEIDVNDIYYPEHFSEYKIVPPIQLQGITTKWGPQDANWFFDFKTSARKTMQFIENSTVYKEKSIEYDGVIAINVRLIEDILKLTGPIDVPDYGMVLTADNFLREVQYEVEEGRDKKPGQNPKKVLKFITPALLDKVAGLRDIEKGELFKILKDRFQNKDIKFYFEDSRLQGLINRYNGSGELFNIDDNFEGDYLAIVNANIAGGKSDAFITQKAILSSKIDPLGYVSNQLSITRKHSGQNEPEWWYRSKNQNYLKIFTPPGSKLIDMMGNTVKEIIPSINYVNRGYDVDPDLSSIERTKKLIAPLNTSSYNEFGKKSFGTWFTVLAGETGNLIMEYTSAKKLNLRHGMSFKFVLDKQSGVESDFIYTIEAPVGFKWNESKSSVYRYDTSKLPARLIIELTLEKEA